MIDFINVSASRGGRPVLHDVSLSVAADEVVALVGRSGSGKTTMLRLVNRLLGADSGEVRVGARNVNDWDETLLRRQTGYVIQDVGLFPHFTLGRNIALVPGLLGWDAQRIAQRVDDQLALVGLDPAVYRDRWPDELSGGQRQRAGLARALAADPPIVLMDEPFGALDPITRADLHREFRRLRQQMSRAVLLVTHDLTEAFALADRIAVLHQGRLAACGTPAELGSSHDPEVRALLETRFG